MLENVEVMDRAVYGVPVGYYIVEVCRRSRMT